MKSFFIEKFQYNHESNQRLIRSLKVEQAQVSSEMLLFMSHILHAQGIWNNRIEGKNYPHGVWEPMSMSELDETNETLFKQSTDIVNANDLDSTIHYQNSQGTQFQNTISDILYHLINHGTYHRGQIMALFSKAGMKTFSTDYIFFKRER